MTLKDMKKKTLSLIEEIVDNPDSTTITSLTNDPDIEAKLNYVINQIQFELSRIKKLPKYIEFDVEEGDLIGFFDITSETGDEVYQINIVRGIDYDFKADGTIIKCLEDGTLELDYYKYPTRIEKNTLDTYEFELSDDVLEIMPYGVAADLLKSDVSNAYGNVYATRYERMKQELDVRYNTGCIEFCNDGMVI